MESSARPATATSVRYSESGFLHFVGDRSAILTPSASKSSCRGSRISTPDFLGDLSRPSCYWTWRVATSHSTQTSAGERQSSSNDALFGCSGCTDDGTLGMHGRSAGTAGSGFLSAHASRAHQL